MSHAGRATPSRTTRRPRLLPLGARPHWGKLTAAAPERITACYERATDFGQLLAEHDPKGKFRNAHLDRYFPLG